jgi:hypothetical protein
MISGSEQDQSISRYDPVIGFVEHGNETSDFINSVTLLLRVD